MLASRALLLTSMAIFLSASLSLAAEPEKTPATKASAASPGDKMVSHDVFFTLKEKTPENKAKLVALAKKYLTGHDGEVFFSAGVLAEDFKREVNDQEFDVALHITFTDKAACDKYATAPRHLEFIKEGKDLWAKVRVFDSYVGAK